MLLVPGDVFELLNPRTGNWRKIKCKDINHAQMFYKLQEEGAYAHEVPYEWLDEMVQKGNIRNHFNRHGHVMNDVPISATVIQLGQINPHLGCRHSWKTESFFSANTYTTCTICGAKKEEL